MVWNGPQFFSVKVTKGAMSAHIPKGTKLDPAIADLDYNTFTEFLAAQHGILLAPPESVLIELKASLRHNPYGFKQNFELVTGRPIKEGVPGSLQIIHREGIPSDLALEGIPFMQYIKATEPQDGMNVHNEITPAPKLHDPLRELILPDEVDIDEKGRIIPNKSGQIQRQGSTVIFSPLYRVLDPTEPQFLNIEFPCSVWIEGDLSANVTWRIQGSLIVDGHLSVSSLEVHGNLDVKLGIQTNLEGMLRVYGNVKTGYLQMSRMGIEGDLTVDRGILQCELRVGGIVKCIGIPGAIQGSKIFCLSSVQANRAGSDQGIETVLEMPYLNQEKPIKITAVSPGTKIIFKNKAWTTTGKSAFSAQPDSSQSSPR